MSPLTALAQHASHTPVVCAVPCYLPYEALVALVKEGMVGTVARLDYE